VREWFYDGLAKIGFLKMFYKFEDFEEKDNPIDELIKDDVTMVKFSKAFKEYKSKKDKNRKDEEDLGWKLERRFKKFCKESERSV
jgi:hypothetical protein